MTIILTYGPCEKGCWVYLLIQELVKSFYLNHLFWCEAREKGCLVYLLILEVVKSLYLNHLFWYEAREKGCSIYLLILKQVKSFYLLSQGFWHGPWEKGCFFGTYTVSWTDQIFLYSDVRLGRRSVGSIYWFRNKSIISIWVIDSDMKLWFSLLQMDLDCDLMSLTLDWGAFWCCNDKVSYQISW